MVIVSYAQSQQTYGIYGHIDHHGNRTILNLIKESMCISNAKKVLQMTNLENFYTHSSHRALI